MPRWIFRANTVTLKVAGREERIEVWIGVEAEREELRPILEEGFLVIPADNMTAEELLSAGVESFQRLRMTRH